MDTAPDHYVHIDIIIFPSLLLRGSYKSIITVTQYTRVTVLLLYYL